MGKEIAGGERSDFTNCYDNSEEAGRRRQQEKGIAKWVVLVVIVAMIVCYNVPATRYQLAGLSAKVGFDKWASSTYEKLGDYKDCKIRLFCLRKKPSKK